MRTSRMMGVSLLGLGFAWAVAAGGSPASHETLVKDMLDSVHKITKELSAIKDAQSAADARPRLKSAATHLLDLRKKADDVKQPNKDEKDRLAKHYKDKFDAALKKLRDETIRVRGVPGGEDALKEISVLNKKNAKK
jgi:hypothetical protein